MAGNRPRVLETRINGQVAVWANAVHVQWVASWHAFVAGHVVSRDGSLPTVIEWANYTTRVEGIAAGFEWTSGRQCWRFVQAWAATPLGQLPSAGHQLTRPKPRAGEPQ